MNRHFHGESRSSASSCKCAMETRSYHLSGVRRPEFLDPHKTDRMWFFAFVRSIPLAKVRLKLAAVVSQSVPGMGAMDSGLNSRLSGFWYMKISIIQIPMVE